MSNTDELYAALRKLSDAFSSEDASAVYEAIYAEGFRAGRQDGVQAAKAALDGI